jgi:hypothetical protein
MLFEKTYVFAGGMSMQSEFANKKGAFFFEEKRARMFRLDRKNQTRIGSEPQIEFVVRGNSSCCFQSICQRSD